MTLTRLQTSAEELIKKAVEISIGENMLNPKIAQYYEKKITRVVASLHKMLDVVATVKVAAKAYKDSVETQRKTVMAESAKMAQTVEIWNPNEKSYVHFMTRFLRDGNLITDKGIQFKRLKKAMGKSQAALDIISVYEHNNNFASALKELHSEFAQKRSAWSDLVRPFCELPQTCASIADKAKMHSLIRQLRCQLEDFVALCPFMTDEWVLRAVVHRLPYKDQLQYSDDKSDYDDALIRSELRKGNKNASESSHAYYVMWVYNVVEIRKNKRQRALLATAKIDLFSGQNLSKKELR